MFNIPVLIVGGGPVGLSASILLSAHGIRSLLVERHPGTSIVPKARGINARTMELYRQHGGEGREAFTRRIPEASRACIPEWAGNGRLTNAQPVPAVPILGCMLCGAVSPPADAQ